MFYKINNGPSILFYDLQIPKFNFNLVLGLDVDAIY